MAMVPTPHNGAKEGDFAKTVLMPGDPLRAKYIAETYLENPRLVTSVRNMLGYTGTYKGKEISVMGGGMGMPSVGIYTYELFNFYGVDNIIRIGSAGALSDKLKLKDVVIGMGACTDSQLCSTVRPAGNLCTHRRLWTVKTCCGSSRKTGHQRGSWKRAVFRMHFTMQTKMQMTCGRSMGVLAVEMEAAALYMNAAKAGKNALCILSISDHIYSGEELSAEERQVGFGKMMEIALELA